MRRCDTKLRIQGNSLRLRLTRSEVSQVIEAGRVEETIYFSPGEGSRLTYALVSEAGLMKPKIRNAPAAVVIALPETAAKRWAESEEVGIYFSVDHGLRGTLSVTVEKDFACLDLRDADNTDTFPNPKAIPS